MDYSVPPIPDEEEPGLYDFDTDGRVDKDEAQRLRKLYSQIKSDDKKRHEWRQKQANWYRMRSVGKGRSSLPFKGASDFHYPLIDTLIEKLKPFYYQQALQPDPLCSFVPKMPEARQFSTSASHWFDFKVRTESNFRLVLPVLIDNACERGKGICKVTWDKDKKKLRYEAIDPVNIIVPPYTEALADADRICHVIYLSKEDYLRRAKEHGWITDTDWIRAAQGRDADEPEIEKDKQWTRGVDQDAEYSLITLWEIYTRDVNGDIMVDLISPAKPHIPVRPSVRKFPYSHNRYPFVEFNYEIKGRGYYDNRGVSEITGQFELVLCKFMNEKMDAMTLINRPIFTHDGASMNVQNLKMAPGQVIGNNLKAVQMPPPPIDFREEEQNVLAIAEERIGTPDFGIGRNDDFRQPRTAKEAQMLQQATNQGVDLRARVFHTGLAELYEQSWLLLVEYCKDDLVYTYRHECTQLDDKALADVYIVEPNGNADGYDTNQEISRIVNILQIPVVAKFLNPEKTARQLLELANPRYIKELFEPGGIDENQYEKQAAEIGDMLNGFKISVMADDDDGQHLKAMLDYFNFAESAQLQMPLLPAFSMYTHFMQHYQKYAAVDKAGFKQDKPTLDKVKGMIEAALPLLQQALQDGAPAMVPIGEIAGQLQQLYRQVQPPPLGPLQSAPPKVNLSGLTGAITKPGLGNPPSGGSNGPVPQAAQPAGMPG